MHEIDAHLLYKGNTSLQLNLESLGGDFSLSSAKSLLNFFLIPVSRGHGNIELATSSGTQISAM